MNWFVSSVIVMGAETEDQACCRYDQGIRFDEELSLCPDFLLLP